MQSCFNNNDNTISSCVLLDVFEMSKMTQVINAGSLCMISVAASLKRSTADVERNLIGVFRPFHSQNLKVGLPNVSSTENS